MTILPPHENADDRPIGRWTVSGVPEGADAILVRQLLDEREGPVLFIARDDRRMNRMISSLEFCLDDTEILTFPAWDCLPYDRISPKSDIVAERLSTLSRLSRRGVDSDRIVVVTTVSAILQKVPPQDGLKNAAMSFAVGERLDIDALSRFLADNGYNRTGTVREPGEFAIRGGIVDLYPSGFKEPVRVDLFGDEIEEIRQFDPMTQRTTDKVEKVELVPVSEIQLSQDSISRFRAGYRELFGAETGGDTLYEAVSAGRHHAGMEHWIALFHERMETLFDYLGEATVLLDHQADDAVTARFEMVAEHYAARVEDLKLASRRRDEDAASPYKPVPPEKTYLTPDDWEDAVGNLPLLMLTPYESPDSDEKQIVRFDARLVRDFSEERAKAEGTIFSAVGKRIEAAPERRHLVIASSAGAKERMTALFAEGGLRELKPVEKLSDVIASDGKLPMIGVSDLEHGFEWRDITVFTEQDILGERLSRPPKRKRKADAFISEVSSLAKGDLVVHVEHGIGRYDGLETLTVDRAPHDCLRVIYANDDKLYVPVENIEMLSRYGSEDANATLDKLGGVAWQARKAKIKERIRQIANELLKIAAERMLRKGDAAHPPEGAFDEFCARFGFAETEDQLRAIEDVLSDMSSGRPMDRLVCGDVGFGKTEVALRAAFVAAMNGMQVAVVVPTTLLARQHHALFAKRFEGMPVKVRQLSRFVTAKEASQTRKGLADGTVDIVVGTHAVLAKSVDFDRLGLVIVDEEQHFGVTQKERLKHLKSNIHVLTLTATPIPRTLQMALAGVREMSIIATPPVDRLAVRTFVMPYDTVTIKEAISRERFRGGQIFYVCPRVADLDRVRNRLKDMLPDLRMAVAHGQMSANELEDIMSDFVDGRYDLLLSTNIVESGLDIPNANTMIVHRADMFGLAQLYQLRGRIGRSKLRAYCYLTLPPGKILTDTAKKRLDVMQTLDTLGAGFTLASHDMDIRGAGNILGDEQSGHIKEVGVELYQRMLEEAVAAARDDVQADQTETWSPTINIGIAVLIPEGYVQDLSVRLSLYRRLSDLSDRKEIDAFAVELADRFGPLPDEVANLLKIVEIKLSCKKAGIEKIDAGDKGAVITFRNNQFANPAGLIGLMQQQVGTMKLRPDHKVVVARPWNDSQKRLSGVAKVAEKLASIATN